WNSGILERGDRLEELGSREAGKRSGRVVPTNRAGLRIRRRIRRSRPRTGERSAGKPPAPFDVAGVGDGLTAGLVRHSQRKRGATARPNLRSTAPALDPT